MALFKKNKNTTSVLIEQSRKGKLDLEVFDTAKGLDLLVDFFKLIRPSRPTDYRKAENEIYEAAALLEENPHLIKDLQTAIISQLINTNLVPTLTESGMLVTKGFSQEFSKRLNQKFLPALQSEKDFLYVINRIFYKKRDYQWVEQVSNGSWEFLFTAIGIESGHNNAALRRQLLASMEMLSYRIANQGIERDMVRYMPEKYLNKNPFVEQNHHLLKLIELYKSQTENELVIELAIKRLKDSLIESAKCLEEIRETQRTHGASLSLTYSTLVISFSLRRMNMIFDSIDNDGKVNADRFINFFKQIVRNEKRKNSLRELFSQSFGYVAYQIAEHKGYKGTKYITTTWKEYAKMLIAAMWGGFIICFVGIFKSVLSLFHMNPFAQGIANSINYSAGFVAIEETHSILATKQPAFTASSVASSFDEKRNGKPNLYGLAVTVGKVFRSQAASFIGNLIVVFPGTFLMAYLYDVIFGHKLVSGAAAYKMLEDQHPFHSWSLLYACNTGFFLFLSSLIAGYVQNRLKYGNVGKRIEEHPTLRNYFSKNHLQKTGNYVEHRLGGIVGNVALGFFLGMSSIVPKLLGINFDIRHITISSANVSIGAYGLGLSNVTSDYLLTVIIGVLGIGFLNFSVSFVLAFIVAVRSRNVKMKDYPEFFKILFKYFFRYPLNFLIPPSTTKSDRIAKRISEESNQE